MTLTLRRAGAFVAFSLAAVTGAPASAEVVLSTNFNSRTVSGATASNLNWTTNGVADPGAMTAVSSAGSPAAALFATTAAAGRFAVDLNLHNESSWFTDISLQVLGNTQIDLGTVRLDAFIFNNSGALQTVYRDLDMTLQLLDSTQTVLDTAGFNDIYAASGSPALQPVGLAFDLSGNTLLASAGYTLRLTASGQGPGNNAGFDNLVVNGTVRAVPEPATTTLLLAAAGVAFAATRRRKRA